MGGTVQSAPPELRGYVETYFTAMSNLLIEPLLVEKQVFSPSQGYAGSFDLIARKDGEVTLIDLKTGGSLYLDNALQLAGYVLADFVGEDQQGKQMYQAIADFYTRIAADHEGKHEETGALAALLKKKD